MKRGRNIFISGLMVFSVMSHGLMAQTESLPKFEEVYQLLLTNSSGLTEAELNQAAVKGLLQELPSQVVFVTNSSPNADTDLISKVSIFDSSFASFRIERIESGLNKNFKAAYQKILSTNKLKGVVLDLRYASGTDYAAAAKTADLFIKSEQTLLRWDGASARSTTKTNVISIPVAVLVNRQTSGAAEALAAMLREAQVGLVIGTNTAGRASVFKEFELTGGQRVKIATSPVKLGNGNEIPKEGLKPDIEVLVGAEEAKAFYENPYRELPKQIAMTTTNASGITNPPRRRLNEAELVRLQREGLSPDSDSAFSTREQPTGPVLSDPVLVRALDLLKGLAIVQKSRRF